MEARAVPDKPLAKSAFPPPHPVIVAVVNIAIRGMMALMAMYLFIIISCLVVNKIK
ncbi:hypothetical protein [Leptothrix ochracea]|uniref:hypothetical protein n=1 Tax=Leptothrix ochracea TaxID=735331 RepID=UPI001C11A4CE|nr:hypothetical protein [Leptothrix ochracea]